jgi:putative transposase
MLGLMKGWACTARKVVAPDQSTIGCRWDHGPVIVSLRRQITGQVRYEPTDRFWFAALSSLLPQRRWHDIFPAQPATILAWHRKLIAWKCDYSTRRRPTGRPPIRSAIKKLVLDLAHDNPRWGHRRIQRELIGLGHPIAASTVWKILNPASIDPAPRRTDPTWKQFPATQAHGIITADFFHLDTALGTRLYAPVFLEHGTRRLHIADVTQHPTQDWTTNKPATSPPMPIPVPGSARSASCSETATPSTQPPSTPSSNPKT